MVKFYAERDVVALGEHYASHVEAMTREGLHEKSEIAAELAFRDSIIEQLSAQSVKDREAFDCAVDAVHAAYWKQRAEFVMEAWGAEWRVQVVASALRESMWAFEQHERAWGGALSAHLAFAPCKFCESLGRARKAFGALGGAFGGEALP